MRHIVFLQRSSVSAAFDAKMLANIRIAWGATRYGV
jgi:hypothetical protein